MHALHGAHKFRAGSVGAVCGAIGASTLPEANLAMVMIGALVGAAFFSGYQKSPEQM